MTDHEMAATEAPTSPREQFDHAIVSLSYRLDPDRLGTGPLAELRRMKPISDLPPPAFWHLYFNVVPPEWQGRTTRHEQAWALLMNAMTLMAPVPHDPAHRPGEALLVTGYSEQRLTRLLRAEDDGIEKELLTAATWLSHAGMRVDCRALGRFVLARFGGPWPIWLDAEAESRSLARDYYRAASRLAAQE